MHQQTLSIEDSHVRPTIHALEPLNAEMWHGKLYDELGDESRALWKELGGTDTAFEVWSKPTTKGQEIAEGIWKNRQDSSRNLSRSIFPGKRGD